LESLGGSPGNASCKFSKKIPLTCDGLNVGGGARRSSATTADATATSTNSNQGFAVLDMKPVVLSEKDEAENFPRTFLV